MSATVTALEPAAFLLGIVSRLYRRGSRATRWRLASNVSISGTWSACGRQSDHRHWRRFPPWPQRQVRRIHGISTCLRSTGNTVLCADVARIWTSRKRWISSIWFQTRGQGPQWDAEVPAVRSETPCAARHRRFTGRRIRSAVNSSSPHSGQVARILSFNDSCSTTTYPPCKTKSTSRCRVWALGLSPGACSVRNHPSGLIITNIAVIIFF